MPIFALCLVIAVVGVVLTRTVALPGRYAGHHAPPATGAGAGEDSGEGTGEGGADGDEGTGGGEGESSEGTTGESPAAGQVPDQPPPADPPQARQPAPRPQRPPKPAPKPPPKPAPTTTAPPSSPTSPTSPTSSAPSPMPPPAIGYEAESSVNAFASTARVVTCQPCSGGRKVGHLGRDAGTLQFNEVSAAADGKVEITITYLNGDTVARGADVSVNGAAAIAVGFPVTGGWNTVATIRLTVTLKAGANTIKFGGKGPAPDVDRISVGR